MTNSHQSPQKRESINCKLNTLHCDICNIFDVLTLAQDLIVDMPNDTATDTGGMRLYALVVMLKDYTKNLADRAEDIIDDHNDEEKRLNDALKVLTGTQKG